MHCCQLAVYLRCAKLLGRNERAVEKPQKFEN